MFHINLYIYLLHIYTYIHIKYQSLIYNKQNRLLYTSKPPLLRVNLFTPSTTHDPSGMKNILNQKKSYISKSGFSISTTSIAFFSLFPIHRKNLFPLKLNDTFRTNTTSTAITYYYRILNHLQYPRNLSRTH